ncbi:MAG: pyridoxal phosphate-dependent aminotransferase [Terriglobia bacterium]
MQLSERISRISFSTIATVLQKAEKLKARDTKLADFGAGEPDFPTPDHIKKAAIQAIEEDFTKYTATGGIRELRQALVEKHAKDYGSNYTVEECLVTVGGKQAIFEAMSAALNDGDEVVLPAPYWVSFLEIIKYAGGKPVLLQTLESENFAVHAEAVEKLLTPKTKLVVVNSPHNPTGAVVPPEEMAKLLALAVRHKLLLISDECYGHFLYDGRKPFSLGSSKERDHLLIVDSFSKTYAMTGWRVGFALGSRRLLANMLKLQSHSTSNPTSIAQKAALAAVHGPQAPVQMMLAEYRRRRDRVIEGLRSIPGIRCVPPQGAFYAYPNVGYYLEKDGLGDTSALAQRLLEDAHVAVVPGTAFGTQEHIRISYATSLEHINEGLRRMAAFFSKI